MGLAGGPGWRPNGQLGDSINEIKVTPFRRYQSGLRNTTGIDQSARGRLIANNEYTSSGGIITYQGKKSNSKEDMVPGTSRNTLWDGGHRYHVQA